MEATTPGFWSEEYLFFAKAAITWKVILHSLTLISTHLEALLRPAKTDSSDAHA